MNICFQTALLDRMIERKAQLAQQSLAIGMNLSLQSETVIHIAIRNLRETVAQA
ncbi:hypothetical protein IPG36_01425 [bacterium]|nr:MAG: hypothetical protein IPG36_01425 [bacterium]